MYMKPKDIFLLLTGLVAVFFIAWTLVLLSDRNDAPAATSGDEQADQAPGAVFVRASLGPVVDLLPDNQTCQLGLETLTGDICWTAIALPEPTTQSEMDMVALDVLRQIRVTEAEGWLVYVYADNGNESLEGYTHPGVEFGRFQGSDQWMVAYYSGPTDEAGSMIEPPHGQTDDDYICPHYNVAVYHPYGADRCIENFSADNLSL